MSEELSIGCVVIARVDHWSWRKCHTCEGQGCKDIIWPDGLGQLVNCPTCHGRSRIKERIDDKTIEGRIVKIIATQGQPLQYVLAYPNWDTLRFEKVTVSGYDLQRAER
jgi:hypothetical protein